MTKEWRIPPRIRWRIKRMKGLVDQERTCINIERWIQIKEYIDVIYRLAVEMHPEMEETSDISKADFICRRGK